MTTAVVHLSCAWLRISVGGWAIWTEVIVSTVSPVEWRKKE